MDRATLLQIFQSRLERSDYSKLQKQGRTYSIRKRGGRPATHKRARRIFSYLVFPTRLVSRSMHLYVRAFTRLLFVCFFFVFYLFFFFFICVCVRVRMNVLCEMSVRVALCVYIVWEEIPILSSARSFAFSSSSLVLDLGPLTSFLREDTSDPFASFLDRSLPCRCVCMM